MVKKRWTVGYFIKAALERAGTTDTETIIKAVERDPLAWNTPEGWKIMRPEDHSVVEDCLWGETTYNEEYGFAMPKRFDAIQGAEICRTAEEMNYPAAKQRGIFKSNVTPQAAGN